MKRGSSKEYVDKGSFAELEDDGSILYARPRNQTRSYFEGAYESLLLEIHQQLSTQPRFRDATMDSSVHHPDFDRCHLVERPTGAELPL